MRSDDNSNFSIVGREELLEYCLDNDVIRPFGEYLFVWPELLVRPSSPAEEISDIFSYLDYRAVDEPFFENDSIHSHLELISSDPQIDVDICRTAPACLKMLLPHPKLGPETLRKYGPNSLRNISSAISIYLQDLKGEAGMHIPTDSKEITRAIETDNKITATHDQAGFLSDIILKYNRDTFVDIILSKVRICFIEPNLSLITMRSFFHLHWCRTVRREVNTDKRRDRLI
jgi:hypothetical protein